MELSQEEKAQFQPPIAQEQDVTAIKDSEQQEKGIPTASPAPQKENEYITGFKLWTVLASVTLVMFLVLLDMSIIVTAIPRITSDFHSLGDVGWYGSSYLLASCTLQPLTGKLYTFFKSKFTFLIFFGLFELGSLLCGVAQSSKMLIIGRAVAGMGISGLYNGMITILMACAPLHKQPALLGIMMAVGQIGVISGPLIGGALTEYASWRWCFYINLPVGGVAYVLLLMINIPDRIQPDKKTNTKNNLRTILSKLDLFGFVLFAGFAIMFLLALEWGGSDYPWDSATVIGLFCGSGGALVLFAAWEYHVGEGAMIPFSLVRKLVVLSSSLACFFFFGGLLMYSYYLPIYFQAAKGVSPALSGVYLLPGILGQMLMAVVSGILVGRLGYYLPWMLICGVLVSIASGLVSTFTPHTSTAAWICYQLLAGLGRGCGMQMPMVAIQNNLAPPQVPIGIALMSFFQTLGGSLFLTFAETIFSHALTEGLHKYAPTVNAETVVTAGATGFRDVITKEQVAGVLKAYCLGVDRNFYLAAGVYAAVFVCAWGMGWTKVGKKKGSERNGNLDDRDEASV